MPKGRDGSLAADRRRAEAGQFPSFTGALSRTFERRFGSRHRTFAPLVLAMIALAACAVTTQQPLSDIEKAPKSGFMSDYSLLQPGKEGQVRLRYVNPNTNWNSYTGIFIEPVVFITDADAHVAPKDEQVLSTYYYNTLKTHLS